ncbi:cytochrome c oxidase subunit 3 [Halococcus sp. AFM35]|uniref:cytochrome c oxidase subunit 3 n=1 Tax=Halococcus sp. AFM35 TaxID=3421653 RepID=UPI003EBB0F6D
MGTNEAVEPGDGQEPPAGADVPAGRSEATWWPVVCALGVVGLYLGAGLYFFGNGDVAPIPGIYGPVVFLSGAAVFLVGLFGWLYHAFLIDFWTRGLAERAPRALRGGMVLFLISDIATFSAGFIYYLFIRAGGWPPSELPGLLSPVLFVNTVALLASSVTLHSAHSALEDGNRRRFLSLLGATLALGVLFVFGQIYEYYDLIVKEGFTISSTFGSAFYGLTGLHGLHVVSGTILLGVLFARGLLGQLSGERDTSMVTVSFYWHFVDLVWVFIVTLLYVGASVSLA